MHDNTKKFHSILVRILEVDEREINDATSPNTVPAWDSYNALMLVSDLEAEFDVHFTIDEVVSVKNVGDIKNALRKHGIEL